MKIGTIIETGQELEISGTDYLVKSVQILAKKRQGKSYTASKIAEELLKENLPICIVDPMSVYYGLKEKFKIVVFGDVNDAEKHADYPLSPDTDKIEDQAELIADFIATDPTSIIIDLSGDGWVDSRQQKFMAAFAKRFYQKNKIARHVFIEEADIFIPQMVQYDAETDSRHYTDHMVRRGGMKGIGTTIISQRASVVSKNVTSQSDLSIFLHLKDKNDLDPARYEIGNDEELGKEKQIEILSRIKSMPPGEAFFYSPSWLKLKAFVRIDRKETYHAGATRGTADFREPSSVQFVKVNIEEVASKLHDIATVTATEDRKISKLSVTPALSDTKMIERQYIGKLAKKDVEIAELNKKLDAHKLALDTVQKQVADMRQDAEIVENLRKLLLPKNLVELQPANGQATMETEQAELTVVKKQITKPLIDEDALDGRLVLLTAEGFFNEGKGIIDIHAELSKRYSDIPKYDSFRHVNSAFHPAIAKWINRPYGYIEKSGSVYVITELGRKYLHLKMVEAHT